MIAVVLLNSIKLKKPLKWLMDNVRGGSKSLANMHGATTTSDESVGVFDDIRTKQIRKHQRRQSLGDWPGEDGS
jgi:hypothetical protein